MSLNFALTYTTTVEVLQYDDSVYHRYRGIGAWYLQDGENLILIVDEDTKKELDKIFYTWNSTNYAT